MVRAGVSRDFLNTSVKVTQVDWFVKISIFKEMFLSAKGRLPDLFIYLFIYLLYCFIKKRA